MKNPTIKGLEQMSKLTILRRIQTANLTQEELEILLAATFAKLDVSHDSLDTMINTIMKERGVG